MDATLGEIKMTSSCTLDYGPEITYMHVIATSVKVCMLPKPPFLSQSVKINVHSVLSSILHRSPCDQNVSKTATLRGQRHACTLIGCRLTLKCCRPSRLIHPITTSARGMPPSGEMPNPIHPVVLTFTAK